MRNEDNPQPFLVAFPAEDGGQRVMLDPTFFNGLDDVGRFLADIAGHFAVSAVQHGRARDVEDALEQIAEVFDIELAEVLAQTEEDRDS